MTDGTNPTLTSKDRYFDLAREAFGRWHAGRGEPDDRRDGSWFAGYISALTDRDRRAHETPAVVALNAIRAKLAEYLERLLQGRTLPNRWVGEINEIVGAALAEQPAQETPAGANPFDQAAILGDPNAKRISMSFQSRAQYEAALVFLDMADQPNAEKASEPRQLMCMVCRTRHAIGPCPTENGGASDV